MSAPRPNTERYKAPTARAANAARAVRVRAARRRNRLVAFTCVLDELCPPEHRPRTRAAVAEFYEVDESAVRRLLSHYADEFSTDGWRQTCDAGGDDEWTDRAVIRAGLLLERSQTAAYVRYRLGLEEMPVMFSASKQRVAECQRQYEDALAVVDDTHQSCPADLWRELLHKDRYDLMAMVVTLAALVPEDQPGLGRWIRDMSAVESSRGSVARGLAMLIPARSRLHSRRPAPPITGPRTTQWGQKQ